MKVTKTHPSFRDPVEPLIAEINRAEKRLKKHQEEGDTENKAGYWGLIHTIEGEIYAYKTALFFLGYEVEE